VLERRGYRIVGSTIRNQAIVYDDIASPADLLCGWTDEQDGGRYRLVRRNDDALFGYAVGPQSWNKCPLRSCCGSGAASRTATVRA